MTPELTTKFFKVKFFSILGAVLVILIIFSFIKSNSRNVQTSPSPEKIAFNPYENLNLTAKSVFVYDIRNSKVLFEKNPDERLPLASVTKLMTALVAKNEDAGDSTIVISKQAVETEGDSGLRVGERWSLKNLLAFSLVSSSNDGMAAVAMAFKGGQQDFISMMNKTADDIGMKNTYYFNETGLDESTQKGGAYGTSRDMATLFAYILKNHPDLLSATTKINMKISSLDNISHIATNTDIIAANIPGLIGSKTGYTDLAGGNLVVGFDPGLGRPIVVAVLGSTASDRFSDVEKLIAATFKKIQNTSPTELQAESKN